MLDGARLINAIYPHRDWLARLYKYAGFTDIEFNPSKSINCRLDSTIVVPTAPRLCQIS